MCSADEIGENDVAPAGCEVEFGGLFIGSSTAELDAKKMEGRAFAVIVRINGVEADDVEVARADHLNATPKVVFHVVAQDDVVDRVIDRDTGDLSCGGAVWQ